ncbi:TBC1 domain family member 12-like [Astyanax mexicanus]|uniref:TBC1 domain family member 12 n=1 Tax=Astyanax mexicanus TaxID=7994 RepID=A0A8B9JST3_ASTMX|nr:TBC1 domain family member 12-like [Astyanax mexicanus]
MASHTSPRAPRAVSGSGCVHGAVNGQSPGSLDAGADVSLGISPDRAEGRVSPGLVGNSWGTSPVEEEDCGVGVVNGFPEPSFLSSSLSISSSSSPSSSPPIVAAVEDGRLTPATAGNMDTMAPPDQGPENWGMGDGNGDGDCGVEMVMETKASECVQLSPAPALVSAGKHQLNQMNCPYTDTNTDRGSSSTHPELPKKVPNGNVGHIGPVAFHTRRTCMDLENDPRICPPEGFLHPNAALEKGVRVGNCGFLVVNTRSLWDAPVAHPGPPETTRSSPGSCESPGQESGHASLEASDSSQLQGAISCDPDPGLDTLSELSGKLSMSPLAENAPEDFGDTGFSARPQSLRTNPGYTVSLSCDATPLSPEDDAGFFGDEGGVDGCLSSGNTYEVTRRQSAPDAMPEGICGDPNSSSDQKVAKRHGIAEFLTRSLFSWKTKEHKPPAAQSNPGWRLFGKSSPKDNSPKDSSTVPQECEVGAEPGTEPHPLAQPMRRKNLEFEPSSTTALILEDRPANLPAKSEEEAQRHRQEYNEMVAGAKRREMKEAQRKKRQMKERYRQEENIAHAMVIWNTEVLPNWESMKNTRRVRELWWQGLPPSVRGKVWSLAIGNELNITPELYEIFLSRAKEKWRSFNETSSVNENEDCGASLADRESSLDLIKLDIFRTFPSLYIFQKGGPYHDLLHSVLGAYTCYRPDVGYVQGMSFIAAVLILNLEEADAFIAFANLLNKPCQMAFFRVDHDLMLKYFAAFEVFFEENLPKLFQHFQNNSLTPDFYLIDWIFTLYSKSLPLDVACRVWDLFCRDGEEALFRTGLGILRLYQDVLLQMDFIHSAQFLSRLPENTPAHTLFNCIANTHMISNNRRWNQVFSALIKDGPKETDKTASPALRS